MKQYLRWISMLLVLLMTVSVAVACNGEDNNDDNKETQKETERETEPQTEQQLSAEEREQLKVQMSESIMQALSNVEQSTEQETQDQTTSSPSEDATTPDYGGVVEGLLGSLGGLGNGDYDYFSIIMEVLDQYIGSNCTSDFIKGLIKTWIDHKIEQNKQSTETESIEADTGLPEDYGQSLQEFIAVKTANAVADAIVSRINCIMGNMIHDAIYDSIRDSVYNSVYDAMIDDEGYMDSLLNEMIPGYGQLGSILGGLGQ